MNPSEFSQLESQLRRGFKLGSPTANPRGNTFGKCVADEFDKLSKWLDQVQKIKKQDADYKDIVEEIEDGLTWMKEVGALEIPYGEFGTYFSVRNTWVPIQGYIDLYPREEDAIRQGIDRHYAINTWFLRCPVLLIHPLAHWFFDYFQQFHQTTASALKLTINVLRMIDTGLVDKEHAKTRRFLESHYEVMLQESRPDFNRLKSDTLTQRAYVSVHNFGSRLSDPDGIVGKLVTEEWCFAHPANIFHDGWFHYITMPSWTLGKVIKDQLAITEKRGEKYEIVGYKPTFETEYEGNEIEKWGYVSK